MGAKQYLMQIKWLEDTLDARLDQIEKLRSIATRITTEYGGNDKVQSSHNNDKLAFTIAKITDFENELKNDIDKFVAFQIDARRNIEQMENEEYKLLLTLRYLNYMTWEQIADQMHYTFQWIHVLHKRALNEFEKTKTVDMNL